MAPKKARKATRTTPEWQLAMERTERSVAHLSEALWDADADASPALARAVQYTVLRLRQVQDEFGLLSSVEAGMRMGSRSPGAARTRVSAARHDLLVIHRGRRSFVPAFQFDAAGRIREASRRLARFAHENEVADRSMVLWACYPAVSLDGYRPVDLLDSDPDAVLSAARDRFLVSW